MTDQKPKLTREFLLNNQNIHFHPNTREEAALIQQCLFKLGIVWCNGDRALLLLDELPGNTITVNYTGKTGISWTDCGSRTDGIVCDISQLDENYVTPLSHDDEMRAQFNALSAKVDRLTALVEKLMEYAMPSGGIDKAGLKR